MDVVCGLFKTINVQILKNYKSEIIRSLYTTIILMNVFQIRNNTHYNLRYAPTFLTETIHSVNGSESASYLGTKIWEQIRNDVKMINSLLRF